MKIMKVFTLLTVLLFFTNARAAEEKNPAQVNKKSQIMKQVLLFLANIELLPDPKHPLQGDLEFGNDQNKVVVKSIDIGRMLVFPGMLNLNTDPENENAPLVHFANKGDQLHLTLTTDSNSVIHSRAEFVGADGKPGVLATIFSKELSLLSLRIVSLDVPALDFSLEKPISGTCEILAKEARINLTEEILAPNLADSDRRFYWQKKNCEFKVIPQKDSTPIVRLKITVPQKQMTVGTRP
jgi:hypothetical protein